MKVHHAKTRYFVVLCLFVITLLIFQPGVNAKPGNLFVHFIDVGQGDAIWLHLPDGTDILVDGGLPQAGPTVVAYLLRNGVTRLDLVVATHGDADHIGGLLDVLEAIPVEKAWLNSWSCTTAVCHEFYEALTIHSVITTLVRVSDTFSFGSVTALVLNPSLPLYANENNNSAVIRFTYGTIDFLLAGDAEAEAEGRMLATGLPLASEIFKVAHHGSNSSSTSAFLSAVAPDVAVISVGFNGYGHPRPEVLFRLAEVGADVFRTDNYGTVIIESDGSTYQVSFSRFFLYFPAINQ
ncbi:MAG: ComEC/Rec2 family competence protein [Anaerolineae bacterium]